MFDDPRTRARSFLESSSIIPELEDILNRLVYERPDDLHGFLVSINSFSLSHHFVSLSIYKYLQANYFLGQSKQPQIVNLILKQMTGPANESALHIDLIIGLRNKIEVLIQ